MRECVEGSRGNGWTCVAHLVLLVFAFPYPFPFPFPFPSPLPFSHLTFFLSPPHHTIHNPQPTPPPPNIIQAEISAERLSGAENRLLDCQSREEALLNSFSHLAKGMGELRDNTGKSLGA